MEKESNLNERQHNLNKQNDLKLQSKDKTKTLLIIISVIALISLIFSIITYSSFKNFVNTVNIMKTEINEKVNDFETTVNENSIKIMLNENKITNLNLEKWVSGGVVTDDFVVEKAIFGIGYAIIDIYPQPSFSHIYKGKGRYDISDRELKASILGLIHNVEKTYNDNVMNKELFDFKKLKIYITTRNYDVATYENGELKLIRE